MAIEVFLEALRTARGDDPERTRRLLELAARLYGEQNGARIVHALLIDLFPVTPLGPGTVRSSPFKVIQVAFAVTTFGMIPLRSLAVDT